MAPTPSFPNPHPEGCFWHDFTEQVGAPNIKWCEPTRCGIISEPANTWSNLPYMILAVGIWFAARKVANRTMRYFGPSIFVMGLFSFIYHASNNFVSQLLDFIGMFFWVYLMVVIDLRRLWGWTAGRGRAVYWGLVGGSSLGIWGLYAIGFPFQTVIAALALVIVGLEIRLYFKPGARAGHYRYFIVALVLLAIAETFSLLDVSHVWCEPENLFLHGHALWHIIAALATPFAYVHFRQFALDR